MNKFLTQVNSSVRSFGKNEEGAQIVEYALIIAVVSLGLIGGFTALINTSFTAWITKVGTCLTTGTCP